MERQPPHERSMALWWRLVDISFRVVCMVYCVCHWLLYVYVYVLAFLWWRLVDNMDVVYVMFVFMY